MDNEKNNLDEIKEQGEEAAQDVIQTVEEADEYAEEAKEFVEETNEYAENEGSETSEGAADYASEAFESYNDSSENYASAVNEPKTMSSGKIIAISSIIATIASVVIMILGSYCVNFVSGIVTANQIKGTWSYNLGSYYGDTVIYVMLDGKEISLNSSDGMEYFSAGYSMSGKNTLKLSTDEETKEKISGLISGTSLDVTYDKSSDSITFNPSIGGIATFNAVRDESEIAGIKEAIAKNKKEDESKNEDKKAEDNANAPSDNAEASDDKKAE